MRNAGWLGLSELANRIFRLGTTVTLARMFSPEDYGLMAIVYVTFEFVNVFVLGNGFGAKIIQADEADVEDICNTTYWLTWILSVSIVAFQCFAAYPISQFYGSQKLILPLQTLSLVYLTFPTFLVHLALIERDNRLKVKALCYASQSFVSNLVTIVLALLGMGVWAIVWAMVLSMPAWTVITWMNISWQPPKRFSLKQWRVIVNFGKNILGSELLNKSRMNLDYLIVGKFLGVKELGIYFFAFNAGSGITMNVVNSLMTALFPHLCSVREQPEQFKQEYFKSLKKIVSVLVPIVLLQSFLAPFYVPIIFGEKWKVAIPILIIICLSVIPNAFKLAASILMNAMDKTHVNLRFDIIYTVIFTLALIASVQWGVFWLAVTVFAVVSVMSFIFNIWVLKKAFNYPHFRKT